MFHKRKLGSSIVKFCVWQQESENPDQNGAYILIAENCIIPNLCERLDGFKVFGTLVLRGGGSGFSVSWQGEGCRHGAAMISQCASTQ